MASYWGLMLACLVTAAGASVGLFIRGYYKALLPLSAGTMIWLALLLLIPEGYYMAWEGVMRSILWGFVVMYTMEALGMVHPCVEHNCSQHKLSGVAWSLIIGHSLFDGLVVGLGLLIDPVLGLLTAVGIAVHHVPVSIMLQTLHKNKKNNIWWALFILIVPIGILVWYQGYRIDEHIVGYVLGLMWGGLLYLGASDILPSAHKGFETRRKALFWMLLGLLVIGVPAMMHNHDDHGHDDHEEDVVISVSDLIVSVNIER